METIKPREELQTYQNQPQKYYTQFINQNLKLKPIWVLNNKEVLYLTYEDLRSLKEWVKTGNEIQRWHD